MEKRALLVLITITTTLLAACATPPAAANKPASNILVIKDEGPIKAAYTNNFETTIHKGVVLSIKEISYMEWDKSTDPNNVYGTVVTKPRRSIRIIMYADWLQLAGNGPIELPRLDIDNVEQALANETAIKDSVNATVNFEPDMQKANARIVYEWFLPITLEAEPVTMYLPFYFKGADGKEIDISLDVKLANYPW